MEGAGRGICHMFSSTTLLLLLLLLITTFTEEMGPRVAEARICESASQLFKGVCVAASNCDAICQTEGFEGGKCKGFRARCICTKTCEDTPSPSLEPTPTFN